jgi:hypothetical protein
VKKKGKEKKKRKKKREKKSGVVVVVVRGCTVPSAKYRQVGRTTKFHVRVGAVMAGVLRSFPTTNFVRGGGDPAPCV